MRQNLNKKVETSLYGCTLKMFFLTHFLYQHGQKLFASRDFLAALESVLYWFKGGYLSSIIWCVAITMIILKALQSANAREHSKLSRNIIVPWGHLIVTWSITNSGWLTCQIEKIVFALE